MRTADFDYHLPPECIAQRPAPRGTARLLVLDAPPGSDARHRHVGDLPALLRAGDLLVANDTRVIPARLFVRRPGGGRGELLLLEKLGPCRWLVMGRPAKRLKPGVELAVEEAPVEAVCGPRRDDGLEVTFSEDIEPFLDTAGHVPLPPYIDRPDDADDRTTYQTLFARHDGAVAAPTAGLHFTDALLDQLAAAGVEHATVTLHVGPGTFRPVAVDEVSDHQMDSERYTVSEAAADAIRRTRAGGGRVVAVGTTVVRTLESCAADDGMVAAGSGRSELFITPGYRYRAIDALLTNFHLPRSTLLMLVSALAGRDRVLAAYAEAVDLDYRFYSYGDAMFVTRRESDDV